MAVQDRIDVRSCVQFLMELFEQWVSPYTQPKTPLMLLTQSVKSVSFVLKGKVVQETSGIILVGFGVLTQELKFTEMFGLLVQPLLFALAINAVTSVYSGVFSNFV
jgi:hypothetical protein